MIWGVYLGLMTLAYAIIEKRKVNRVDKILESDRKNCERKQESNIQKYQ